MLLAGTRPSFLPIAVALAIDAIYLPVALCVGSRHVAALEQATQRRAPRRFFVWAHAFVLSYANASEDNKPLPVILYEKLFMRHRDRRQHSLCLRPICVRTGAVH